MAEFQRYAEADIPTPRGDFRVIVYRLGDEEHLALVKGDVFGVEHALVRVHSECMTGEVFGSMRCDCREQLESALDRIADEGRGALVYMRQEGRGIGLGNKVRAYALQDQGIDTVDANLALGFGADERTYELAASIINELGIKSVRLMTNNPDKLEGLERAGVSIAEQVPHWVTPTEHSEAYIKTKKARLGHIDDDEAK